MAQADMCCKRHRGVDEQEVCNRHTKGLFPPPTTPQRNTMLYIIITHTHYTNRNNLKGGPSHADETHFLHPSEHRAR